MSLMFPITDWLFTPTLLQLGGLLLVVLLASIVRGAIGFGFSALVVASGSFWLPPVAIVSMVVALEIVASLLMWHSTKVSIQKQWLIPLTAGGVPTSLLGVWLLPQIPTAYLQLFISSYLSLIALLTLGAVTFKANPGTFRLSIVGMIAGLFNGLAGIGGVFIAMFLSGSRISVRDIRATLSIYFLLSEAAFLVGAGFGGLYTSPVLLTSLLAVVPMFAGIWLGTHLFTRLPEALLRRMVLVMLLLISGFGLLKTLGV